MYRIAICDDDPEARQMLESLAARWAGERGVQIV